MAGPVAHSAACGFDSFCARSRCRREVVSIFRTPAGQAISPLQSGSPTISAAKMTGSILVLSDACAAFVPPSPVRFSRLALLPCPRSPSPVPGARSDPAVGVRVDGEPRPPPRFTTPVAGLAAREDTRKVARRARGVSGPIHGAHQRSKAFHDGALPICQSRRRIARATDREQRHVAIRIRDKPDLALAQARLRGA
jgi:hypothetical protein